MAMTGHTNGRDEPGEVSGNAVDFFLDRHIREGRGSRTAFIDEAGPMSYSSVCDASCGFARGLARADIRREARIALILLDSTAFPIAFWGALRAGIIPVLINTKLPADQIAGILNDCRVQAVIVASALLPALAAMLADIASLRLLVVDGDSCESDDKPRSFGFAAFIADGGSYLVPVEANPDELAFLLYTSGSSGAPKGVRHVHGSLRVTADSYGAQILGITAQDVIFSAAKLFFAYGLGNSMIFPQSAGAAAVLSAGRPTAEHVLAVIACHRPTIFCASPSLFAKLLQQPELGVGAGSDRLRLCVSAGEALPAHIGARWRAVTGLDLLDGVGTTEMLHIFVSNRPGAICHGAAGRAVPGYDLRLVDDDGHDVEGAGAGELLVRGASMADGYWNQRSKTQRSFRGEWMATGDRYRRDAEGLYRFSGRIDDMIKVNGIWVSPCEVEASLISHDAVAAAAVVGRTDRDNLTKPHAFIVLRSHASASLLLVAELQEYVRQQIGTWKYPRWIDFVPDLPETVNGKIQRSMLRGEQPEATM